MSNLYKSFTIPSKIFDWGKWWFEMSSIQRQNWLRYWRLERVEELRQEKRDQAFKDHLFEKYYMDKETNDSMS